MEFTSFSGRQNRFIFVQKLIRVEYICVCVCVCMQQDIPIFLYPLFLNIMVCEANQNKNNLSEGRI